MLSLCRYGDKQKPLKAIAVRDLYKWWEPRDSNPGPHACEACALTS